MTCNDDGHIYSTYVLSSDTHFKAYACLCALARHSCAWCPKQVQPNVMPSYVLR